MEAVRWGYAVRVVVSVDMEGISQLAAPREIASCCEEYWALGKSRMEADTAAAVHGLLDAGASEVIVLDHHGSGNPQNISAGSLPASARLETWNVFGLAERSVDAMLQVGYHARGGTDGFISHTFVPGLRLRIGGELISESHGRAWAAGVPLIGIVGNDTHEATLGSLSETPYLVVQKTLARDRAEPAIDDPELALEAIREFSAAALRGLASIAPAAPPAGVALEASMPNDDQADVMSDGGWTRRGDVEYVVELTGWPDARTPLGAAMNAGFAPLMSSWTPAESRDEAAAADPARVARLAHVLEDWCGRSYPEWYRAPAVEIRSE
jgi:D-amino peptidase